jgi:hypothetical protein
MRPLHDEPNDVSGDPSAVSEVDLDVVRPSRAVLETVVMLLEAVVALGATLIGLIQIVSSIGYREPLGYVLGPVALVVAAAFALPACALWRRWRWRWSYQVVLLINVVLVVMAIKSFAPYG